MVTTTTGRATDFIQFSRTSNATVTDSDGKIKWAGHNLLTNSESFDASAWAKSSATVTANSEAAPNNTTTGDTIAASGANGTALQSYTALAVPYTFGVWLKRKTGTGTIEIAADNGTYTAVTITSSWALYTVTQTPAAGSKSAGIRIVSSGDEVYAWGAHIYRSDLGGMVLNPARGDAYYPTTPRNLLGFTESLDTGWSFFGSRIEGIGPELVSNGDFSSGTTTGWTGFNSTLSVVSGALQFTVSTNGQAGAYTEITTVPGKTYRLSATFVADAVTGNTFLKVGTTTTGSQLLNLNVGSTVGTYSGVFVATGTTAYVNVITSSGATAGQTNDWDNFSVKEVDVYQSPNGLTTARAVEATTANGTLLGSLSLLASPYTFSIWLKRKTGTGTVEITVDGTTYVTVAVTSDWQRFSTTLTPSAGTKTPGIRLVTSGDAVYAWGAQLSDSASLDAYSPVYGAAVTSAAYYAPRLDYDANGSALGLLVEEQRTNLLLRSSEFNATPSWFPFGSSVTANTSVTVAPDGTLTADKIVEDGNTSQHGVYQSIATTATSHTFSVYAKAAERSFIYIQCDNPVVGQYYNLSNGTLGNSTGSPVSTITAVGNGWYRCTMTLTAVAATPAFYIILASANGTTGYAGNGSSGAFVWGAQLEIGASGAAAPFATSYIPTGASQATRNADVASVSTQAFPYSATEGTIVAAFDVIGNRVSVNQRIVSLDVASNGTFLAKANTTLSWTVFSGGSLQATLSETNTTLNAAIKSACAFKASDFASSTNGATPVTASSGSFGGGSQLSIGTRLAGDNQLNGHIRQITYLPRRITNAELQSRSV